MPKVTLILPSVVVKSGNRKQLLDASTMREVVDYLCRKYPELKPRILSEDGGLSRFFNFYVNGRNIVFTGGLDTKLNDGDEISLLPSITGG